MGVPSSTALPQSPAPQHSLSPQHLTMTVLPLLLLLTTAVTASILPVKVKVGSMEPTLGSVKQCEGHEEDSLYLIKGSTPDSICIPGVMEMNMDTEIRKDLHTDLQVKMAIKKLTPFPMNVPCLSGIGSCEYEICPIIEAGVDTWCPSFPESQPCGCPLKAGEIVLNGIELPVQDMGPVIGPLMEGDYRATATFYGASAKDEILGCVEFTFTLKDCHSH